MLPLLMLLAGSCQKESSPPTVEETFAFEAPVARPVTPLISEASGIADSKANPGFLWVQEDGGNAAQLILLSHTGTVVKTIPLKNAGNRDWEDMVRTGDQLYIADIGDNNEVHDEYRIYQLTEPSSATDSVASFQTIRFRYPDGAHDAEAFLVDEDSRDIYILTKRDNPSRLYKLAYPYSYTAVNVAASAGSLAYSGVVSAARSPDGKHILVKTYSKLYHYARKKEGDDIGTILSATAAAIPYQMEPQGEALTFAADNSGFFTLSEKGLSNSVNLYFYRRK